MLGRLRRGGPYREAVRERRDGVTGDREAFEPGLRPRSALQFLDLRAVVAGKGLGGGLLDVERIEQGLRVSAASRG
ncbi:hypothetical protein [Streptomyces lavendulae]|uniref:hypothetical protein n=1 Tax=Streptomyces lavendulae TaxID=1914 RepID=UPI0031F0A956